MQQTILYALALKIAASVFFPLIAMTANLIDGLNKFYFVFVPEVGKLQQVQRLLFLIYKSDLFETGCE